MRLLVIGGLVVNLWAGYVGEYLGMEKGKLWAYTGTTKDSAWGIAGEFSITETYEDTLKIIDEFIYQGDSAYLREEIAIIDETPYAGRDTVWEEGDSLIGNVLFIGDSTIKGPLYKTPFEIGKSWYLSKDTLYLVHMDMDDVKDTVIITEDLVEVKAQEDIAVPYGKVEGAYRLEWIIGVKGTVSFYGYTFQVQEFIIEWYKPFLGPIKDTTYWYLTLYSDDSAIGGRYMWEQKVLTHTAGVEEKKPIKPLSYFRVMENPFRDKLSLSFSLDRPGQIKLSLYDITGREIGKVSQHYSAGRHTFIYKPRNLSNGVYFLRFYKDDGEIGREKVIKID